MVNRLTKLVLGASMLFLGLVGFDLSKEKGEALETIAIFGTESFAFGCGANNLNHQTPDPKTKICFGSGDPTDFTVEHYFDCLDELNSCCPFPGPVPTCPSIGG